MGNGFRWWRCRRRSRSRGGTRAPRSRTLSAARALCPWVLVLILAAGAGGAWAQESGAAGMAGSPAAPVRAASQKAAGNLLVNGDFAHLDGSGRPAAWQAVGAAGRGDRASPREGAAAGLLERRDRGEGAWCQPLEANLVPGARYVVSAWVRGNAGDVAFVGVETSGADCRRPDQLIYRGLADDQWQTVSMEFTAPASGRVAVWLGGEFARRMWWDEAVLAEAETLPERVAREWEERFSRYGRVYTGLVVDTRGLRVERGMSPRIVDTDGNLLYAGLGADLDEWVIRRGIVSYLRDLEPAVSHPRLAAHETYPYRMPLVIEAVGRVEDGYNTNVIVRAHDAAVVRRHLQRYDFLARFSVVFIID